MGIGTNRDYKSRNRRVDQNLAWHFARMNELIASGMDRTKASEQAFEELRFLPESKRIVTNGKAQNVPSQEWIKAETAKRKGTIFCGHGATFTAAELFAAQPARKEAVKREIYEKTKPLTTKFYSDNNWQGVHQAFALFDQMGLDWNTTSNEYHKNADGIPDSKTWKFEIRGTDPNGKPWTLYGYMTAAGAGSVQDPLDRYDLNVVVS